MSKLKNKLKAIKNILFSDEYFVISAKQKNPYGETKNEPIVYDYITNTDRELFYVFVKNHIENLQLTKNLK